VSRRAGTSALAIAAALLLTSPHWARLGAQVETDGRLARLDATTRATVRALVDSARIAKLPTEPLVDKALEGAEKGADGPRIIGAVRGLSAELRTARNALGAKATTDEITAGAQALHAGLQMRDLARLRAAAQQTGRRRVTLPLTVAADLVARDVPATTASDIVLSLTRSGVRDAELATFQRNVRLDIEHGADPGTAAQTRARGALLHAGRTS
jgi:hypothetical protein